MKNINDTISGLVLLGLCGLGIFSVSSLPPTAEGEAVGTRALPSLAVAGTAVCACLLLLKGLVSGAATKSWGDMRIVRNVLLFFCFFLLYLMGITYLGDWFAYQTILPWSHGGFAVSTFLFLLISLRILGRKKPLEIVSIAFLGTAALLVAFMHFFQVMLP